MDDERDYTYKELLTRIFDRMNKDKPELAGRGKRVMMQPPQVAPYGSRKTIFINFPVCMESTRGVCDCYARALSLWGAGYLQHNAEAG